MSVFRGSETDVLDRFYRAALAGKGDIVLRFTSDCPLIDPALVDQLADYFRDHDFDYAAIDVSRFPRGLDAEIVTMAALETGDLEAARAAGMPCVAALWGYREDGDDPHRWGADHVAAHASNVLEWLP